jgi:hypothetical protein
MPGDDGDDDDAGDDDGGGDTNEPREKNLGS